VEEVGGGPNAALIAEEREAMLDLIIIAVDGFDFASLSVV